MTIPPTPASTDHTSGPRWVAAASTDEIRDLMRTLARSPHAEIALSELFSEARAVGAYYTWTDMEVRAGDLLDSIEDQLERTLTAEEFDTLVGEAWARFATTGVTRFAQDVLREELFGALWGQVEILAEPTITPEHASAEAAAPWDNERQFAEWERVQPPAIQPPATRPPTAGSTPPPVGL